MKKILPLVLVFFLASCGLQYTPVLNTSNTSSVNFQTDIRKEASACAYGILWLPPFVGSDISVVSIARDNNFKKVVLTDSKASFLILFNRVCTVVYGE